VLNFKNLAGGNGIFGQLWKEYALGDSRYLIRDTQVLSLEALSVACYLVSVYGTPF
jgi:cholestenol Delta-isomerase